MMPPKPVVSARSDCLRSLVQRLTGNLSLTKFGRLNSYFGNEPRQCYPPPCAGAEVLLIPAGRERRTPNQRVRETFVSSQRRGRGPGVDPPLAVRITDPDGLSVSLLGRSGGRIPRRRSRFVKSHTSLIAWALLASASLGMAPQEDRQIERREESRPTTRSDGRPESAPTSQPSDRIEAESNEEGTSIGSSQRTSGMPDWLLYKTVRNLCEDTNHKITHEIDELKSKGNAVQAHLMEFKCAFINQAYLMGSEIRAAEGTLAKYVADRETRNRFNSAPDAELDTVIAEAKRNLAIKRAVTPDDLLTAMMHNQAKAAFWIAPNIARRDFGLAQLADSHCALLANTYGHLKGQKAKDIEQFSKLIREIADADSSGKEERVLEICRDLTARMNALPPKLPNGWTIVVNKGFVYVRSKNSSSSDAENDPTDHTKRQSSFVPTSQPSNSDVSSATFIPEWALDQVKLNELSSQLEEIMNDAEGIDKKCMSIWAELILYHCAGAGRSLVAARSALSVEEERRKQMAPGSSEAENSDAIIRQFRDRIRMLNTPSEPELSRLFDSFYWFFAPPLLKLPNGESNEDAGNYHREYISGYGDRIKKCEADFDSEAKLGGDQARAKRLKEHSAAARTAIAAGDEVGFLDAARAMCREVLASGPKLPENATWEPRRGFTPPKAK